MESPKVLLQVEIFCNDIIEDYAYHSDKSDNNLLNCGLDNELTLE